MNDNGVSVGVAGFFKVSSLSKGLKIIVSANGENENSAVMISNGKRLTVRVSW